MCHAWTLLLHLYHRKNKKHSQKFSSFATHSIFQGIVICPNVPFYRRGLWGTREEWVGEVWSPNNSISSRLRDVFIFRFWNYVNLTLKRQPHEMIKHTQTIRRCDSNCGLSPFNCCDFKWGHFHVLNIYFSSVVSFPLAYRYKNNFKK